jgi:hypothetical protein
MRIWLEIRARICKRLGGHKSIPSNQFRQAGNRFLGSLKALQLRTQRWYWLLVVFSHALISQDELIPRRNRFLLYENLLVMHLKSDRWHMDYMKSLFQFLKLRFYGHWATLFRTRFLTGSYLVPTRILALMTASKTRPLNSVAPDVPYTVKKG